MKKNRKKKSSLVEVVMAIISALFCNKNFLPNFMNLMASTIVPFFHWKEVNETNRNGAVGRSENEKQKRS